MNTLRKVPNDIGSKLAYFLATGNLVSKTGLDLQQVRRLMKKKELSKGYGTDWASSFF